MSQTQQTGPVFSGRASAVRASEVVLSLVASGLVGMRGWAGVRQLQQPYHRSLQLGLDRLAALCVRAGRAAPVGVQDLVGVWCAEQSVDAWPLEFDPDAQVRGERLLIGGEPSEFCLEWAVAAKDVVSEVHESALVKHIKDTAALLGRPELYARWRLFVTSHAVLGPDAFLAAKNAVLDVPQWATWMEESYGPVPVELAVSGRVAVCGGCEQWIVPRADGLVRCRVWRCGQRHDLPGPVWVEAEGARRLEPELVRFVALPGHPELDLAQRLAARGARVVLYPKLDSLDLVALWPDGYSVGVDVKDWHSPYLLARRIKTFPRWGAGDPYAYRKGYLVVPHDRLRSNRSYLKILERHSAALRAQPEIEVVSDRALVASCPDVGPVGEVVCGA
ncbi:hypothetical protein RI578_42620 (plasmid) [Streptomyces sp. BB1-1-1]|uniref:pPIWI_RE_Y domain-containing protein n=1 Tax=Streptomyces sp. BB1-1-1 TaxID=3074430 RepID=UPI0028779733|nr:hypothetical protein [Streptomyces sp. BB1-1-1]WND32796.1 hypothetical protein RI578_00010 [Streptomyces sp. BB1-1-1]WND40136.1 hypothetical protein RI578_40395 [Streptomyces sp. BB1-1-1]WND40968.1 hypothetical protein RI578_42620 [Streptomyces sp. BB1-1-1]